MEQSVSGPVFSLAILGAVIGFGFVFLLADQALVHFFADSATAQTNFKQRLNELFLCIEGIDRFVQLLNCIGHIPVDARMFEPNFKFWYAQAP